MIESYEDLLRYLRQRAPAPRHAAWVILGMACLVAVAYLLQRRGRRREEEESARRAAEAARTDPAHRADFRVPMHLAAEVVIESTGALLHGTLAELSAGGATVTIERDVHSGERVLVRFRPGEGDLETLPAEILRIEHAAGSARRYLHCRFLDLTPRIETLLLHVIAERQRALLREPGRP